MSESAKVVLVSHEAFYLPRLGFASAVSAHAVDEVYNAEIAKVGQWTMQLHLNYALIGRKEPDFPGGLIHVGH